MKTSKPEFIRVTIDVQLHAVGPPYNQYRVTNAGRRWMVEYWIGPTAFQYVEVTDRSLRRLCIGMAKAEITRIARL